MKKEEKKINLGKKIIGWEITEFEGHQREKAWYLIAGGIAILLFIFALATKNYLFALIVLMAAFIIVMHDGKEGELVPFSITDEGILIGRKFIDYDELKDFSIVYKPHQGVKNLYFRNKNTFKPRISISLAEQDPLKIRNVLIKFLDEDLDRTDQPLSEGLAKLLKL